MVKYWTCAIANTYIKMYHIDQLYLQKIWKTNNDVFRMKAIFSGSKHFRHCTLEVHNAP